MRVVGLTGGIATGKSTVSNLFKANAFPVVDADVIARDVLKRGSGGWKKVVAAFGDDILLVNGEVDRPKLGHIVFTDPSKRQLLNRLCQAYGTTRMQKGSLKTTDYHVPSEASPLDGGSACYSTVAVNQLISSMPNLCLLLLNYVTLMASTFRFVIPRKKLSELDGNSCMERCTSCGTEYFREFVVKSVGLKETSLRCSYADCDVKLTQHLIGRLYSLMIRMTKKKVLTFAHKRNQQSN